MWATAQRLSKAGGALTDVASLWMGPQKAQHLVCEELRRRAMGAMTLALQDDTRLSGRAACTAWARRVASAERSRPAISSESSTLSTSAGSRRCARAVASTSGAARHMYGTCIRHSNASTSVGSGGGMGPLMSRTLPKPRFPSASCAVRPSVGPCQAMLSHRGASAERGLRRRSDPGQQRWPAHDRPERRCTSSPMRPRRSSWSAYATCLRLPR